MKIQRAWTWELNGCLKIICFHVVKFAWIRQTGVSLFCNIVSRCLGVGWRRAAYRGKLWFCTRILQETLLARQIQLQGWGLHHLTMFYLWIWWTWCQVSGLCITFFFFFNRLGEDIGYKNNSFHCMVGIVRYRIWSESTPWKLLAGGPIQSLQKCCCNCL